MNGTPNNLLLFWKRLTGREEAPGRSWATASLLWSLLMLLGEMGVVLSVSRQGGAEKV